MARLALISVVLCFLAVAFVATADTDINFYFADMLAGANSGSCSSSGNSGSGNSGSSNNSNSNNEADAAYAVEQTITSFFDINTLASNDVAANVVYSKYAPLITPLASDSVVISTTAAIVNNGTPSTYNGLSGVVDYLAAVSTARNSSYQELTNLVFDFSSDLQSVTVTAIFSGLESLNSNFSYQTFFGHRTYQLVADDSKEFGYAVASVSIIRDVTRPSPEFTSTFRGEAQDVVLALFDINDQASDDNAANVTLANYGAEITPLVTSDFSLTSDSPLTGNKSYTGGVSAFVDYLHDVSSGRMQSQQSLSSFEFSFNDDQSVVVVSTKFTGFEQLSNGSYDTFYGTRVYTVVRGDDGVFRVQNVAIVRSATFTATLA